jgi:hypothetical protein
MKIDDLKKVIRQLVREEVNKAMGKVLVELIKEVKSPTSSIIPHTQEDTVDSIMNEPAEERPLAAIIKTSNPKLASVLAETARNFKPNPKSLEGGSSLVSLMGQFGKIGKSESLGISAPQSRLDYLKEVVTATPDMPSALDGGSEVPDILKKVFKTDFRKLMKKIDETKKTGGSGLINPSQVLSG